MFGLERLMKRMNKTDDLIQKLVEERVLRTGGNLISVDVSKMSYKETNGALKALKQIKKQMLVEELKKFIGENLFKSYDYVQNEFKQRFGPSAEMSEAEASSLSCEWTFKVNGCEVVVSKIVTLEENED